LTVTEVTFERYDQETQALDAKRADLDARHEEWLVTRRKELTEAGWTVVTVPLVTEAGDREVWTSPDPDALHTFSIRGAVEQLEGSNNA
jgi:phage host-nuclease inhibitor protein Gam